LPGLQGCEGDRVTAAVAGAGYVRRDGSEKISRVEIAFGTAAVVGSAARGAALDPLRVMLANSLMNGGLGHLSLLYYIDVYL